MVAEAVSTLYADRAVVNVASLEPKDVEAPINAAPLVAAVLGLILPWRLLRRRCHLLASLPAYRQAGLTRT